MSGRENKMMLTIRIDPEAMHCLERVAAAGNSSAAQVMVCFFEGLQSSLELVDRRDLDILRDGIARLLLAQMPEASPEALKFAASIWDCAAQLKDQQGGDKK